jgi:hypothetical protein
LIFFIDHSQFWNEISNLKTEKERQKRFYGKSLIPAEKTKYGGNYFKVNTDFTNSDLEKFAKVKSAHAATKLKQKSDRLSKAGWYFILFYFICNSCDPHLFCRFVRPE